ncbi:hypothetical protein SPURM210S_01214 [Streptomyces purpurascens]
MPSAVRFGVNYTPSEGWFHHWLDFDLGSVRADLDSIAALGLDHIRVFPLWPYFQPNRTLIRPRAVEQLVALADAAAERGLDVNVDGLQGHLSSFDFLPAWTRTWHRRNLFTDPDVLDGQENLLRTLAAALADRPNFIGMTLGNEVNQFSSGPHPDPDRATSDEIDTWLTRMLAACEEGAPGRLHLHAEYDATWYQDDQPFTPGQAARHGAVTAVHSWVFNGTAQRHGRTSVPAAAPRRVPRRAEQGLGRRPAPAGLAPGGRRPRAPGPRPSTPPPSPRPPWPTPWTAPACGASPGGAPTTSPATSPTSRNWSTDSAC